MTARPLAWVVLSKAATENCAKPPVFLGEERMHHRYFGPAATSPLLLVTPKRRLDG